MASPLHRHQSSLEGVINFAVEATLTDTQHDHATRRFYQIVEHFEAGNINRQRNYNQPLLVRLTYDYARSRLSQDNFLRAFFSSMALELDSEEDVDFGDKDTEADIHSTLIGFAEHLFNDFFLPLKASSLKTPQHTPAYHNAVLAIQGGPQDLVGSQDRLSTLRGACLTRDRHRCVISRAFHQEEAVRRYERAGGNAQDDDGVLFTNNTESFEYLEVAHIIPHSLTKSNANAVVDPHKETALAILNMFDSGVGHLIEGSNIDRPYNAITITANLHRFFGNFKVFFEALPDQEHTYRINSFLPPIGQYRNFPITRTLYLTADRTIDPPSPRLLAIHNAIAHILHLSAAGEYIDKILRDMEEIGVRADGSTELGRFVQLGLGGWLDSSVRT